MKKEHKGEKISVIIPVYNVEKYVEAAVNSIQKQTYKNLEIIIVNDGSTDSSKSICEEIARCDDRIKIINQKNSGLSAARNTGIAAATGDYVIFQDSDDTLSANAIGILLRLTHKYRTKIASCGKEYVFEDGNRGYRTNERKEGYLGFEEAIEEMNRYEYFDMSATAKLFKKDIITNDLFPIGLTSEDFYVMPELIDRNGGIAYTTEPLYGYLQRRGSISKNKKISEDFICAAKKQMETFSCRSRNLEVITHVAYASAVMTVVDLYLKNKVRCENIRKYKKIVKNNKSFLKTYKKLSKGKRIQFRLFVFSYPLYRATYLIYKNIKKV